MMARGVRIGNEWRRARLVEAYYHEQKTKVLLAQAVAHAAGGTEHTDQKFRDLINHMFPSREMDDQTIEEMQEVLEEEEKKEYFVKPLFED